MIYHHDWVEVDMERVRSIATAICNADLKGTVHLEEPLIDYQIPGVAGEIAFSDISGLLFGQVERAPDGTDRGDFEFGHWTIDIKTQSYKSPLLVKKRYIDKPIDIYVLAEYNNGWVRFHGWQWTGYIKKLPLVNYKLGDSYKCEVYQLKDMNILLDKINEYGRTVWTKRY